MESKQVEMTRSIEDFDHLSRAMDEEEISMGLVIPTFEQGF